MREITVWIREKGYELPISELIPHQFDDLVDHRIFETMKDMHYTLMALDRGASKYSLEHGLACPVDTRKAVEKIISLPKY